MVFFTDRDVGARTFPALLLDAGLRVERHCDHFAHDSPDAEWIPVVSARGWVVVTYNIRIARTHHETEALRRAGGALLLLTGANSSALELASNFVNSIDTVTRFVDRTPRPFVATLSRPTGGPAAILAGRPGRIRLKFPPWPG